MAEPTIETPQAIAPVKEDPYELGDTNLNVELPEPDPKPAAKPAEPAVEPPAADVASSSTDRPRNPDGTFAKAPKHDAFLVHQAEEFGYSPEDIEGLTPGALTKVINQHRQHARFLSEQFAKQQSIEQNRVRAPEPNPPAPVEEEIDLGIDESEFDPKLVAAIKKLAKSQQSEVKSLKSQLAERDQRDEQRDGLRLESVIDSAFSGMGERYEKIFGKGAGRDIAEKDKPGYRRRLAVLRDAQINPRTMTPGQIKAKIKEAADVIYPQTPEPYSEVTGSTAEGSAVAPRITPEQWSNGGVAKPTQRRGEEPKGDAKAVKNLTARMREQGGEVMSDSEELDGFF